MKEAINQKSSAGHWLYLCLLILVETATKVSKPITA